MTSAFVVIPGRMTLVPRLHIVLRELILLFFHRNQSLYTHAPARCLPGNYQPHYLQRARKHFLLDINTDASVASWRAHERNYAY